MKKYVITFMCSVFIFSCIWFVSGSSCYASKEEKKVVIAQQFGLGYAPIMVMNEKKLIEKYIEGVQIEWVQLGSGGAIREAMAAGTVDIGSMGVPPFLIAWAKGIDFKVITALCQMPLGLQTYHKEVKTLADITPEMKIALPSPGSIQHILLSMAVKNQLGDPKALDSQIVAMPHPDGANALLNKVEIDAHFTSPPYIFIELENEDIHQVVDAEKDSFDGPFTFLVTVSTGKFRKNQPLVFDAVFKALEEAIDWIDANPRETAKLLSDDFNMSPEKIYHQLTWPGVVFDKNPKGMLKFLEFMQESGYVERTTNDAGELIWDTLDPSLAD